MLIRLEVRMALARAVLREEVRMALTYNIYCDESCHLENDQQNVMTLGAVWCLSEKVREISSRMKDIKKKHGLSPNFELKWTKVSKSKQEFYLDILDYFLDDDDIHFRALVVPEKSMLRHDYFHQDHDTWYYKMYFDLLRVIINPSGNYYIFLDIKDTRSAKKVEKLRDVLCSDTYDFEKKIIKRLQVVRSHEVQLLQLTDFLTGIISYANRALQSNAGKLALVERLRNRTGYSLVKSNLLKEEKLNIFVWRATEIG
jgi:hypothetical protein